MCAIAAIGTVSSRSATELQGFGAASIIGRPYQPSSLFFKLDIIKLMNKWLLYSSVFIFSSIGGYIPSLWHAGFLSASGIIGGVIGTIAGIWIAFQVNNYVDF